MKNNVEEIKKDTVEYIDKLVKVIEKSIKNFYSGNEKEGLISINNISIGIDNVLKVYISFYGNKEEVICELNSKLNELVDGIEDNDFILVADILNYEIKSILINIMDQIKKYEY